MAMFSLEPYVYSRKPFDKYAIKISREIYSIQVACTSHDGHEGWFHSPDGRLVSRQKEKETLHHWVWCTAHKMVSKRDKNGVWSIRKTGEPGVKTIRARREPTTNSTQALVLTLSGIEPGPHWWKADRRQALSSLRPQTRRSWVKLP